MRLKKYKFILLTAVILFTGCSKNIIDTEIQIPIYEEGKITYKTAVVEKTNLIDTESLGASVGYPYGNEISYQVSGNIISFNIKKNQIVEEGEILAVVDSSSLDFKYNELYLRTESAYQLMQSKIGSNDYETARLDYEINKKQLEIIEYEISTYTIRAPYSGLITSVEIRQEGEDISKGDYFCTLSFNDKPMIYTNKDTNKFRFGMKVTVKVDTTVYNGTVVSASDTASYDATKDAMSVVLIDIDESERQTLAQDANAISAGWATITINDGERYDVLAVPDAAVKRFGGQVYCDVLINDMKYKMYVETGESIGGKTEILSGLREGDLVIL